MSWGVTLHRGRGKKRNTGQMRRFAGRFRAVPWTELFKINSPVYETVRITPDSSARNWRTEDITRTIADMFKLPIDRFTREGLRVRYHIQENAAFEMEFAGGQVHFYLSTPANVMPVIMRRLQAVWPDATIENHSVQINEMVPEKTAVYELIYKRHDLYSLHTDAKDNLPIGSLLEAGRALGEGQARVFTYMEPIHQPTWHNDLTHRWEKLREGHSPKKFDASARNVLMVAAVGITQTLKEVMTAVSDIVSSSDENIYKDKPVDPLASQYTIQQLTRATSAKTGLPGLRTRIWVAVESANADVVARTMAQSFGDLAGDNELQPRPLRGKKKTEALRVMTDKRAPKINIAYNVFSSAEAAKLVQIPGRELQEKYPEIVAKQHKETNIDKLLTRGGILIGEVEHRGEKYDVYQPLPSINTPYSSHKWDLAMQTRVAIGPPGSGKSTIGTNWIVEAVRNGLGAVYIDPAKGLIGDEVEKVLPPEKIKRFNLAKTVFGLDWVEVKHAGESYRDMLADAVMMFFDDNADAAGAQTTRFLESAIHGMQTGKLKEIVSIFRNKEYRQHVITSLPEQDIHRETLEEYNGYTPERQRQIAAPIFNRLNIVLGNTWLSKCMDSDESIDLVELMTTPQAVIFDVLAKDGLTPKQIDILCNLISTKIMLAMKLRPEEKQIPYWVIYDEPAQMVRSTKIWEAAVTEARKWRMSFVFLFHEWMQLNDKLRNIIKSVAPHYHIYAGASKHTWKDLKEEIYPIDVESAMRIKQYHAVNVIRTDNGTAPAIFKMAAPPSDR